MTQNLLSSGQFNVIQWVWRVEESPHLAKPELSNCSLSVVLTGGLNSNKNLILCFRSTTS